MYNKIFTKILDSSIWLEPTPTRVIWLTFIAAMDETGFAQFAGIANLAHRARVAIQEAQEAVECLQAPDGDSSDPEHDGRRIERVPGGWMILNAPKYREIVTRAVSQEQTRLRVNRYREKKRNCNGNVTPANGTVTPSEADAEVLTNKQPEPEFPDYHFASMTPEAAMADLQRHFPDIDIWNEFRKLRQLCIDKGTGKPTWRGFIGWLKKASPVVKLRKSGVPVPLLDQSQIGHTPISLDEQAVLHRELQEMRKKEGI